jgi:hypothetical protein
MNAPLPARPELDRLAVLDAYGILDTPTGTRVRRHRPPGGPAARGADRRRQPAGRGPPVVQVRDRARHARDAAGRLDLQVRAAATGPDGGARHPPRCPLRSQSAGDRWAGTAFLCRRIAHHPRGRGTRHPVRARPGTAPAGLDGAAGTGIGDDGAPGDAPDRIAQGLERPAAAAGPAAGDSGRTAARARSTARQPGAGAGGGGRGRARTAPPGRPAAGRAGGHHRGRSRGRGGPRERREPAHLGQPSDVARRGRLRRVEGLVGRRFRETRPAACARTSGR